MRLTNILKLQIKASAEGRFTLGLSELGDDFLASNNDLLAGTTFDWVDVSEGTMSMKLTRGVNSFGGVEALPIANAGVLRVQTKNRLLDPYTSQYIKPKKAMRLVTDDGTIVFQGKVDNIQVDYRSEKQEPIITFDIVDPVADLQQASTKLNNKITSVNKTWNQRVTEIMANSKRSGQTKQIVGGGTIKHSAWADNYTVWEALVLAQTTESGFIYFDRANKMWAYGKGAFTPGPSVLEFSNVNYDALGYKNIVVDANSDSVINEIQVSNAEIQSGNNVNEVLGPYRKNSSVNTYGAHVYNVNTNFYRGSTGTDNTQVQAWVNNILAKNATPQIIVKTIEWDAKKNVTAAAVTDIGDTISVEYQTEFMSIDRELTVVGITHEIYADDDKWRVTYTLFEKGRFS
jgi:hypothetical protein